MYSEGKRQSGIYQNSFQKIFSSNAILYFLFYHLSFLAALYADDEAILSDESDQDCLQDFTETYKERLCKKSSCGSPTLRALRWEEVVKVHAVTGDVQPGHQGGLQRGAKCDSRHLADLLHVFGFSQSVDATRKSNQHSWRQNSDIFWV